MKSFKNTLLQFNRFGMGGGDEKLSLVLAENYLNLLLKEDELPQCIVFYNEGVKLLCEDNSIIEPLKELQKHGVKLIACKTCLNAFQLIDQMQVGLAGTMPDIIELQKAADKVITL